jgi:hypothetical protein
MGRPPTTDIRMFFRGTVVDRVMREWLDQDSQEPGQMADMVDRIMDREEKHAKDSGDGVVKWRTASDREETRAWCKALVGRLEPLLARHALPYEYQTAVRFDVPYMVPLQGGEHKEIRLTGEIDLLVRWPDQRWAVWDLKGTDDNSYWRKTLGQLTFYEIACWILSKGKWPAGSGLLQPNCDHPDPWFVFEDQHRTEMFTRINQAAWEMWHNLHRPKDDSEGCSRCFFMMTCPRYAPIPGSKRVPIGLSGNR